MPGRNECSACGAPIRWEKTENGKAMPLNQEPDPTGNVVLVPHPTAGILAHVLKKDEADRPGTRYMPHHATCERAASFRKAKRK